MTAPYLKKFLYTDVFKLSVTIYGNFEVMMMERGFFNRFLKNKYFGHLLTDANILKLAEHFSLQELKRGLKFADSMIFKKINSLNYLVKTIETEVEKTDITIQVKFKAIEKKSKYSSEEIIEAYRQAEEEGLNLSCLKWRLLLKTLEYKGFLPQKKE